ncbi:tetratricopeptide repeat protein [Amycolatopsis orientalis]|uniref:tetratricopeptide repeat protein n=1 Tax=Amycolatopsis orientalis TaxID=31958 RepID=UPI001378CDB8|nr:tetratricopeptide repeat protein [Amycolatopsis orientalis]
MLAHPGPSRNKPSLKGGIIGTVAVVPDRRPAPRSIRVFVSYAHETPHHKDQVHKLCRFLHQSGLAVELDEWATDRRRDWYAWMTDQVMKSDFVLVIASEAYRRAGDGCAEPGFHRGVQTEAALLRDLLHADRNFWLPKMLPVILPEQTVDHVPLFLQPFCADFYQVTEFSEVGCEELLRALTGRPSQAPPPVGGLPALPPYTPTPHAETARMPGAATLPRDIRGFTGRETEFETLLAAVAGETGPAATIHTIDGMPGIGKTAFAIHVAHRLAPFFPHGQLYLELHGHAHGQNPVTSADALASLLLDTGVAGDQIPSRLEDRIRLWRERVRDKNMLLVLDDARDHGQVADLIPDGSRCLVLITSRRRLASLGEAHAISLNVLEPPQAAEMFIRLSRTSNTNEKRALARLMRLCGHLPLAISVLAGRLRSHPNWTLTHLEEQFDQAQLRVAELSTGNPAIAAAFSLSYRDLSADQQRLFRRLGLHPGPDFDARAAAALDNGDVVLTRRRLEELYLDNLIDEPVPGRYRLHDLIHEYARILLENDPVDERNRATDALLDDYLRASIAAGDQVPGDAIAPATLSRIKSRHATATALRWLETERANLLACAEYADVSGRPRFVVGLSAALHSYLRLTGRWDQARTLHRAALAAARRSHERREVALAHRNLGVIDWLLDFYPSALKNLQAAQSIYRRLRDQRGQAATLIDLGAVHGTIDDYGTAIQHLSNAYTAYCKLNEPLGQAIALSELGATLARNHDYDSATETIDLAFALFSRLHDRRGQANVLNVRATLHHALGRFTEAKLAATRAYDHYAALGDLRGQAIALNILGALRHSTGEYHEAIANHQEAFALYSEIGSSLGRAFTLNHLGCALHGAEDHVHAFRALTAAHELFNGLNKRTGQADALNNLGELARSWHEGGSPLDFHRHALVLAEQTRGTLEMARAYEGIGRSELLVDDESAIVNLNKALRLYKLIKAPQADKVAELIISAETTMRFTITAAPSGPRRIPWPRRGRHRFRRRHSRD